MTPFLMIGIRRCSKDAENGPGKWNPKNELLAKEKTVFKQLKRIILVVLGLYALIAALHVWLNIGFEALGFGTNKNPDEQKKFRVGFLPVT